MKKNNPKIGVLALTITVFGVGILAGSVIENNTNLNQNSALQSNKQIAVVNLDEGTFYNHKPQFYANQILTREGSDVTITGYADALNGLKSGQYSSYVIIPTDFSKNMTSINNNPQKSLIKFEIGNTLNSNDKDEVYDKIMKLKDDLNDDLGYMYIKSALGEFHIGQDNALKVLNNDKKEREILAAISDIDLIKTINIGELKKLNNNVKDLNITPDIKKNQNIINQVKNQYKVYLNNANLKKKEIEKNAKNVNDHNSDVKDKSEAFNTIKNNDDKLNFSLDNSEKVISDYNSQLKNHVEELQKKLDNYQNANNSMKQTLKKVNTQIKLLEESNKVQTNSAKLKKLILTLRSMNKQEFNQELNKISEKIQIENKLNSFIFSNLSDSNLSVSNTTAEFEQNLTNIMGQEQIDALSDYAKLINTTKINYNLSDYIADQTSGTDFSVEKDKFLTIWNSNNTETINKVNELVRSKINTAKLDHQTIEKTNDLLKQFPIINSNSDNKINKYITSLDIMELKKSFNDDIEPLNSSQKQQKIALLNIISQHMKLNKEEYEQLNKFDFQTFIKNEQIKELFDTYTSQNEDLNTKIQNKKSEYINHQNNVEKNANENIDRLHDNIQKQQKASDEQLKQGLKNVKQVRNVTNNENQKLLNDFISKLKNTRKNKSDNEEVYQIMNHPLNEQRIMSAQNNKLNKTNYIVISLAILGGVVTLLIVILTWLRLKK